MENEAKLYMLYIKMLPIAKEKTEKYIKMYFHDHQDTNFLDIWLKNRYNVIRSSKEFQVRLLSSIFSQYKIRKVIKASPNYIQKHYKQPYRFSCDYYFDKQFRLLEEELQRIENTYKKLGYHMPWE